MAQARCGETQEKMGGCGCAERKEGWFRICFVENDVRLACRMMLWGDHSGNCISLMTKGNMTCEISHAVLKALKKRPENVRASQVLLRDSATDGPSSFLEAAKSRGDRQGGKS